jgi:hypothetical protein
MLEAWLKRQRIKGARWFEDRDSARTLQVTLSAAKIGARVGAVREKARPGGICLCIDRREDKGTWGLAREDARQSAAKSYTRHPEIVEEWKWMETPVWCHGGIVGTGETYKNVVKMTFAKGAALPISS